MYADAKPRVNPWIVTCAVMLSTFMEILDTTVVNSSIPHIAGNLSSTVDEGTWVVTSYLVANAIILPMTGWLSNFFGRKRLLLVATASFTLTSVMCGMATSLEALIAFRVLQGLSGGCMQPLAQAILLETFPPKQHGQAMAAFSLGILLAPIVGPALGGWITDNYSWRWIFYLNVPVGLLSLFMVTNFVFDPDYLARVARRVDGWGIGLLALWIGALQIVLDTGQKRDWFGSNEIRVWTFLCVAGLIAFLIREFTCDDPVVDLRVFLDRTFAAGAFLITIIGFMLYASLVLLPIYLQTLLGYPAFDAGLAISPRGLGALIMMPVCGMLIGKVPSRLLIAIGLVIGGMTMWQFARLNLQSGYWDIFWPQVFQGFGMAFLFIPITTMSVSHIAKPKMGNATSIFNLVRNIGGSFGIAIMTTFLARRSQFHLNRLGENVSIYDPQTQYMLGAMKAFFIARGADAYTAGRRALGALYGMTQQHAAMMAFVEAFAIMSVLFISVVPLVLLMTEQHNRKPAPEPPKPESAAPRTERQPEPEHDLVHV